MDSPCESESSLDGGIMLPPSPPGSREQMQKRIDSLTQQNRVLKVEMETYKIRVKVLQEENRALRQASVIIQAKAEQEEEYISNTLLKKIQALKKEKETLAHQYEREEECLTNDLSRKLDQLRQEKCKLEQTLEQEQECLVNKLMRKIEKLEAETLAKQNNLEQLRREKIELENTLEQEQEALVNKLWKRMDKLEAEKRSLQIKLDQPVSEQPPTDVLTNNNGPDTASSLSNHIQTLRSEIMRLRSNLATAQKETTEKTQQFAADEKCIREENMRLQRKLQLEVERREALCRHLSESESSLEMEEERMYNESFLSINSGPSSGMGSHMGSTNMSSSAVGLSSTLNRQRTISSPVPQSPSSSRPISPGGAVNFPQRCCTCGQLLGRRTSERFIKPAIPTPGLNSSASSGGMPVSAGYSILGAGGSGGVAGISIGGRHNSSSDMNSSVSSSSMINSFSSSSLIGGGTGGAGGGGGGGSAAAAAPAVGGSASGLSHSQTAPSAAITIIGSSNSATTSNPTTPTQQHHQQYLHTFIQPSSPMDISVYKE